MMRTTQVIMLAGLGLSATTAQAAQEPKGDDAAHYCVPLRDAKNQPTGSSVCKTEQQWRTLLATHYAREAMPRRTATFYTDQSWRR